MFLVNESMTVEVSLICEEQWIESSVFYREEEDALEFSHPSQMYSPSRKMCSSPSIIFPPSLHIKVWLG